MALPVIESHIPKLPSPLWNRWSQDGIVIWPLNKRPLPRFPPLESLWMRCACEWIRWRGAHHTPRRVGFLLDRKPLAYALTKLITATWLYAHLPTLTFRIPQKGLYSICRSPFNPGSGSWEHRSNLNLMQKQMVVFPCMSPISSTDICCCARKDLFQESA